MNFDSAFDSFAEFKPAPSFPEPVSQVGPPPLFA
jgi:hypothetical protein